MSNMRDNFHASGQRRVFEAPEKFVEKFNAFKVILKSVGGRLPQRWDDNSPIITGFNTPTEQGQKMWLHVRQNAVHLRYYDISIGAQSGLGMLEIDKNNECYILNKCKSFNSAEFAIEEFVKIIGQYGDNCFMRPLYMALHEDDTLEFGKGIRQPKVIQTPTSQASPHERAII